MHGNRQNDEKIFNYFYHDVHSQLHMYRKLHTTLTDERKKTGRKHRGITKFTDILVHQYSRILNTIFFS